METEDKIRDNAKKSAEILYSPKIFDEGNKNQISFYKFKTTKPGVTKNDIGVLILKYNIDNIPQEVIMGTLENSGNSIEQARIIKNLIEQQLKNNSKNETNFKSFKELNDYITKKQIPFNLTVEGSGILVYNKTEKKNFPRTYYEEEYKDKNSALKCNYTLDRIQEMEKTVKEYQEEIFKQIEIDEKWKQRRELILKKLEDNEEKKLFLKGEKIAQLIEDTDTPKILKEQKDIIADYLIENYEMFGDSDVEIEKKGAERLKDYVAIKEKGIAIDAKIILEEILTKYEQKLFDSDLANNYSTNANDIERAKRTIDTINNYCRFFDCIKTGRDFNARLVALKFSKIDFSVVRKVFTDHINKPDKELLKYLELKENEINDIQLKPEVNIQDYKSADSVKDLYKFLAHSSVREHTKVADEKKQVEAYNSIKVDLIVDNVEAIQKYNYYAEKSGIYVCPLPESKEAIKLAQEKRRAIPNSLQKLTEIPDIELQEKKSSPEIR